MNYRRSASGFTLIEVMIVVAIIGLLASIAFPSYKSSILKGKRAQARTALAELLQQQERYATQRNTYLAFTSSISGSNITVVPATATGVFKAYSGDATANPPYILSAGLCTTSATPTLAECVRVIATPSVVGSDPEVNVLRMTSTGIKDCTGSAAASNPKLCWP